MANMSYCRFSNTLSDLRDCYEHIDDELSPEEQKAREALIRLCGNIANEYEDD
jgi:hypothetical protein